MHYFREVISVSVFFSSEGCIYVFEKGTPIWALETVIPRLHLRVKTTVITVTALPSDDDYKSILTMWNKERRKFFREGRRSLNKK